MLPPWSKEFSDADREILEKVDARRQLRPYRELMAYRGPTQHTRKRRRGLGCASLGNRSLNLLTITQVEAEMLVDIFEELGILLPKPPCGKCVDGAGEVVARVKTSFSKASFELALGIYSRVKRDRASWRCSTCNWERSVGSNTDSVADVWAPKYTVRQNALLFYQWCRPGEPTTESLARDAMVDSKRLTAGWLHKLRLAIEHAQEHYNSTTQLGGIAVDVEVDEICFRASWTRHSDGTSGKEWMRYIAAMERDGDDIVVMRLDNRFAKGGGQGWGGHIER